MLLKLSLILQLTLLLLDISSGLKLQPPGDSGEESCAVVAPQQSFNKTWFESVDFWYFHGASRAEWYELLYLFTTPEEFGNLTDEEVQKACIMRTRTSPQEKSVRLYGLGRKLNEFEISFPKYRKGVMDWALIKSVPEHVSTSYIVLTDNKTYYMAIDIFDDGTKGYYIAGTEKAMSPEELMKVKKVMKTHKFSEDSFYPLNSDCEHDEYLKIIRRMETNA